MGPMSPGVYLDSANTATIQNMPAGLRKAEVKEVKLDITPVQRRG